MNKDTLNIFLNKYRTVNSAKKRIEWCKTRPKHIDDIPYLEAVIEKIIEDRRVLLENNYNEGLHKAYEDGLAFGFIYPDLSFDDMEEYLRFFFPFNMIEKASGELITINKLGYKDVIQLAGMFVNNDKFYSTRTIDELKKKQCTGKEFYKRYSHKGFIDLNEIFDSFPKAVRCVLYNMTAVKSTNIGKFEILLGLCLTDVISSKKQKDEITGELKGDIICASGVSFEIKAYGGRMCCQKIKKNFVLGNKVIEKECNKYGIKDFNIASIFDLYNKLKSFNISKVEIKKIIAKGLVNTYGDNISVSDKEKFEAYVINHFEDYYYGGKFTIKSAINLQGVFDTWSYSIIENFTHLIICSKSKDEINWRNFDVFARIFLKSDLDSPEKIFNLLKMGIIYFDGKLNENSVRDVAVHIYIKKGTY